MGNGEEWGGKEKCSWWFYGSITNFSSNVLLSVLGWLTFAQHSQKVIFQPTHTTFSRPVVFVKMKILFHRKSIHPRLLLFYYLFYDWIKWPIVKVNDSQRHKIAHSLLWLSSIILFNDKLGLSLIYSSLPWYLDRGEGLQTLMPT